MADFGADEAEIAAMFAKKKKKKPKVTEPVASPADDLQTQELDTTEETYDQLLERIYVRMGVERDTSSTVKIKPPKVERIGSKKTAWTNFRASCETLKRPEDHLSLFFSAGVGTMNSITQEGALLIRGILPNTKIESLVRKYIEHYVKCPLCRSSNTTLRKDSESRLMMLECNFCKATRSVAAITTGFHATMKGDRKKLQDKD